MTKEYTAVHHIRDNAGTRYTPGEIFDADFDEATEERLLKLGAVIVNGKTADAAEEAAPEIDLIEDELTEIAADDAPVIDVMEGISTRKRGRKS